MTEEKAKEDGREVNVGVLGPGEVFGERSLGNESTRSDRAVVLEDAVLCEFGHRRFERFLLAHPKLALQVTKSMGERLRRVEGRIQDILFKDVRTRLAHTLARLAENRAARSARSRRPRTTGAPRYDG